MLSGAVLSLVIAATVAGCSLLTFDSDYDNKQIDKIEATFEEDPAGWGAVADHMEQLIAANPGADEVYWGSTQVCAKALNGDDVCREASEADMEAYSVLPSANGVFYFARDADRFYIRFNQNDPPETFAMYAPDDSNPEGFAKSRGFRAYRAFANGWSLLGPIGSVEQDDFQWQR